MVSICPEVFALKGYEEEVAASLLNANLDCLTRETLEIGVIHQNVRDDVKSIDWDHVPRPRVIRYLLMHVYRSIEDSPKLYERWLRVLSKHVASAEVLDKVRQNMQMSAETMRFAEGMGHDLMDAEEPTRVVVGAKRPQPSNAFTEQHIPILIEVLAACAGSWSEVSIFLGLPEHVKKDLRITSVAESSIACFGRLLGEWIVGNHSYAKEPTLENMEKALRSQTVGLGSEANRLRSSLNQRGMNFEVNEQQPSLPKKQCHEVSSLEVVSQSCDIVVTEGKSALLEVQTVTGHGANISYQWLKDGRHLGDSKLYSNILCIKNADLLSSGKYTCELNDGLNSTTSRVISVNVDISSVKKVLVDRYSAQPEVPEDSWPPAGADTYINLALIKPGNIEKAGEYARNTIQGNMDDIMAYKESVEYNSIFTNLENTMRLLIEGRPGSGKTTLVHRFSKDWASGNPSLNLKNIKLLFLVHLRGFFNDPCITLRDIIELYFADESTADTLTCEAEESSGEGFCFILDGLDEYRPKAKKSTFIFKLIKKLRLPNAVVIIASRPAASAQFRSIADKKIEVIGFLKDQIGEYVEKYPFTETNKGKDLFKYLEGHPNVHHMCYLPIHAAMVCYLFNIMGGALPRTETEMYTDFTTLTLLRTIRRKEDDEMEGTIMSAEDLPENKKELFLKICKLGFEKTVSSKQVMRKNEVSGFFRDVDCGEESMGLITVDCKARKCGFENLYTFLHLTFQEYLAAYHIFKLSETDQLQVLSKYGRKKHMQVVWKFYCGLTNLGEDSSKFCEIMKSVDFKKDSLFGAQCAFESQQSSACDYVVESGECGTLSLQGHFLTPPDFIAVGYVFKKALCPVEKLVLNGCKLEFEALNAFLDEAGDRISSVKTLCFHGKGCVVEQYQMMNFCLQKMTSIEVFDISNTNLGSKKLSELANSLTLPNLRMVKVSKPAYIDRYLLFNSPKIESIVILHGSCRDVKEHFLSKGFGSSSALFFRSMSSLAEVDLQDITLNVPHLNLVAGALKQLAYCTSLNVTNCNIGDGGCEALVAGLIHCHALKKLVLCCNQIGNPGAKALAEIFRNCTEIETLNLMRNCIGEIGAIAIAETLKNYNLVMLNVSYNHIGNSGAAALAHCLNNISILSLRCTKIGDEGAISLAEFLKKSFKDSSGTTQEVPCSIRDLDISYNHICDIGALALSESLRCWACSCNLNLAGNKIGDEGAVALARAAIARKGLKLQMENMHRITESGCTTIASMQQGVDASFRVLNINSQNLEDVEVLLLNMQDDVKQCENIREIRLYIRAFQIETLAAIVKCCYKFKRLNLTFNHSRVAGRALTEIISHCEMNNSIKTLDEYVHHCNISSLLTLVLKNIDPGGVKALVECLQHCNNLHTLNLSESYIGADGAKALAEGLPHCRNLQMLNLEQNGIGQDGVISLAENLQHCNNLQILNFEQNGIGCVGASAFAESLKHCNNLHTLNLGKNGIGVASSRPLSAGLQYCKRLQTLDLSYNDIGVNGTMVLAKGLEHCNHLQTLNLGGNNIGPDGAKAFAKSLPHLNNVLALNLEENNIDTDGAKALAEGLHHCSRLQMLNLRRNDVCTDGAKALSELQHCNSLQVLNLDFNSIGVDGAMAIAEGLQHYSNLKTLNLVGNSISADGVKALAEGLQHCKSLNILDIGENDIGDDGVKAIAGGLQYCCNLNILDIAKNSIGDDGAKALAESLQLYHSLQAMYLESGINVAKNLQYCSNLQSLNLEGNHIGPDGAKALAESLQHCNNLLTLNLDNNHIGADGTKALAESLQHCNTLQTLNLEGNGIDADGAKALVEGLQHWTGLQVLNLSWNDGATADDFKTLAEGLLHCKNLQALSLNFDSIGGVGTNALSASLHWSCLRTLNLQANNIYASDAISLSRGLKLCKNLQTLNLEQNSIGSVGAKALTGGLQDCNSLQTLNFVFNGIGAEGAKSVAEDIQHCKNLYLGWNDIGDDGAKGLAGGLQYWNNLQVLNVRGNSIGADGAKALAESLHHCSNLHALDLRGNFICADAAKALTDSLRCCNSLQTLDVGEQKELPPCFFCNNN